MVDDENGGKRTRMSEEERRACLERLSQRHGPLSPDEIALLPEVFALIVREHEPRLLRRILKRGIPRAEAQDLVQEVFAAAYGSLKGGFPQKLGVWLYLATRTRVVNHLRAKQREPFSHNGLPSSGSEPPRTPPQLERELDRQTVPERVLSELSEEERAILEAVEVDELSYDEAAEVVGLPLGTFKRRLKDARERLAVLARKYRGPEAA